MSETVSETEEVKFGTLRKPGWPAEGLELVESVLKDGMWRFGAVLGMLWYVGRWMEFLWVHAEGCTPHRCMGC